MWPNIGSARQYVSDHVQEALQTMVELMRSGKSEKVRMDAATPICGEACATKIRSPDLQDGCEYKKTREGCGGIIQRSPLLFLFQAHGPAIGGCLSLQAHRQPQNCCRRNCC